MGSSVNMPKDGLKPPQPTAERLGNPPANRIGRRHRAIGTTCGLRRLLHAVEPWLRRPLPCPFACPQHPHDGLELLLELGVVALPAGEIRGDPGPEHGRLAAVPAEQAAVEVQRDHGEDLLAAFPPEALLLLQRLVNLPVDPGAPLQRSLRAAEEDLVPKLDAAVDLVEDRVSGQQLLLVEPAADAADAAASGYYGAV